MRSGGRGVSSVDLHRSAASFHSIWRTLSISSSFAAAVSDTIRTTCHSPLMVWMQGFQSRHELGSDSLRHGVGIGRGSLRQCPLKSRSSQISSYQSSSHGQPYGRSRVVSYGWTLKSPTKAGALFLITEVHRNFEHVARDWTRLVDNAYVPPSSASLHTFAFFSRCASPV